LRTFNAFACGDGSMWQVACSVWFFMGSATGLGGVAAGSETGMPAGFVQERLSAAVKGMDGSFFTTGI
jgi:hypothetical protein